MQVQKAPLSIAVVIPTYNRAQYLRQTLDSLLEQSRKPDEIIVIDDGSSDGTQALAGQYGEAIRYFRQENTGKAIALNRVIPRVTATHVIIFDDDDVMLPDALKAHEAFLLSHPEIDYTYSSKFYFEDYAADGRDIFDAKYWRLAPVYACPPEELFIKTMEWNGTLMQGMAIPVRCFAAIGLFSEELHRSEDYDMLLRLARRFRGMSLDQATFVHRFHAGPRGSGAYLHKEKDRFAVWHDYDRKIFRALRRRLTLAEYLPLNPDLTAQKKLTAEQQFDALFQRGKIMFLRGLFAEGAADLCLLLAHGQIDEPRFQNMRALVQRSANIGQADYVPGALELAKGLRAAPANARTKTLIDDTLKGLYWGLRGALHKKQKKNTLIFMQALAILVAVNLEKRLRQASYLTGFKP